MAYGINNISRFSLFVPQNIDGHKHEMKCVNVCVNEMAPFGPYAAVVKGKTTFDSDGSKGVLSTRREIADPPGTNVFPIEINTWTSLKVSCLFVHCVVCIRRR